MLFYELGDNERPLPLCEIRQRIDNPDSEIDLDLCDNKLCELRATTFRSLKKGNIAFVLSAIALDRRVNLFAIDMIETQLCCFTRGVPFFEYQHLREINFFREELEYPMCVMELSHNRFACAVGNDIEVVDVHNEKRKRITMKGHEGKIRSFSLLSKQGTIEVKTPDGDEEIMQNDDFLVSTGEDKTVRIWKVPSPLTGPNLDPPKKEDEEEKKKKEGEEKKEEEKKAEAQPPAAEEEEEEEDYGVLNI